MGWIVWYVALPILFLVAAAFVKFSSLLTELDKGVIAILMVMGGLIMMMIAP